MLCCGKHIFRNTTYCCVVTTHTAVPAEGNGDLQTLICVLVARPRRCLTLSNPVPWQNWMVSYLGYTLRMRTLFRGWPIMVNDTHTRRRRSRLRTWRRARAWKLQAFATFLVWQSNCRLESMVTSSDLSFDATGRVLPATSTVVMLAADWSRAGVPRKTTSDLSALSCRPFCRNQKRTTAEQWARLSMAGVALVLSMLTACHRWNGGMTRPTTRLARQQVTRMQWTAASRALNPAVRHRCTGS